MTPSAEPHRRPLPAAFWRQWAASAASNVGDGMNLAALPLLAYTLTDDARLIAAVSFALFVPWLVLALPVGVWVDRWDRQRTMVVANVWRAGLFAVLAVTATTDQLSIELLLIVLAGVGVGEVFFDSTAQAFLPAIVEPDQLARANGYTYAVEVVGNGFVGLPLGAWLFVAAIALPFSLNAASFLIAAALIGSIRFAPGRAPTSASLPGPFRQELTDGFRWLREHQVLRTLAVLLAVTNISLELGLAVFVKFAADELGVSPRSYGLLLAVTALGSVAGGLIGDRVAARLGSSVTLVVAYAMFGACQLAIAVAPNVWIVAAIGAAQGAAIMIWNIVSVSLRQRLVPAGLFGRVNGIFRWVGTGSIAIGSVIGGQIAYHINLRAPFAVGGVVTIVALAACSWAVRPAALTEAEQAPAALAGS